MSLILFSERYNFSLGENCLIPMLILLLNPIALATSAFTSNMFYLKKFVAIS